MPTFQFSIILGDIDIAENKNPTGLISMRPPWR
jgi:hypothetical protein